MKRQASAAIPRQFPRIRLQWLTDSHLMPLQSRQWNFETFFHPYADELLNVAITRSVDELQAADSEFTTVVALENDTNGKSSLNADVNLIAGEQLVIANNTVVKIPEQGDNLFQFSDDQIIDDHTGLPFNIANKQQVTLLQNTKVIREEDNSVVILSADTIAELTYGGPRSVFYDAEFFKLQCGPNDSVINEYPIKALDFDVGGAYGIYNWEIFYHLPFAVAVHLSNNQRFEEAQRWFHFVFDPRDASNGKRPQRFWKFRPFKRADVTPIEAIFENLELDEKHQDMELFGETIASIQRSQDFPFRPHLIARYRPSAYMFKTVMAYLDNLIAWGDSLFREDTIESINEATQIYVLAANILGPFPQPVPKKPEIRPQTYAEIRRNSQKKKDMAAEYETSVPVNNSPGSSYGSLMTSQSNARTLALLPYNFCTPQNDKLFGYWDTVADRLFKIHNSLNFQGVFRQLPLYESPIDPALLAKGVALGVDVGAILRGEDQALPLLVRFQLLIQKVSEICQEVKSLGNNLLSAMEKEDNEALALMRAKHEREILGLSEMVRYGQWQEAVKSREGLQQSIENVFQRYSYYERLLGKDEGEIGIPEIIDLDAEELEKLRLVAREPIMRARAIEIDIAQNVVGIAGRRKISSYEASELEALEKVGVLQEESLSYEKIAGALSLVPQFDTRMTPLGVGVGGGFGGVQLSGMASKLASFKRMDAERKSREANMTSKMGAYARREQDWAFQSNLAAGEITQLFKQLRATQIREAVAKREWENHQQQIRNAEEIEQFLTSEVKGKQTNQAFYAWMKREIKGLYSKTFQFAYDLAKKAERALQQELGNPDLKFIDAGYLAGKEGLLAGEKLYFDVKRMEMAYHDNNAREYEITKHISLRDWFPLQLLLLRKGKEHRCSLKIPEALFDVDCPGHYFRRIKSVSLTIPCVVGPYINVNCALNLSANCVRTKVSGSNDPWNPFDRRNPDKDRFATYSISVKSIVTSTAQNDSGMFEPNLRDERYLPFEGAGVISDWEVELLGDPKPFDYDTIADVILSMRYTARPSDSVKTASQKAETWLDNYSSRLFSIRHEFPSEWTKFQGGSATEISIELKDDHYPYRLKDQFQIARSLWLVASSTTNVKVAVSRNGRTPLGDTGDTPLVDGEARQIKTEKGFQRLGMFSFKLSDPKSGATFTPSDLTDLWLIVDWNSG